MTPAWPIGCRENAITCGPLRGKFYRFVIGIAAFWAAGLGVNLLLRRGD